MLVKTEGIVIRNRDYGEGNKIITIFSLELGKIAMMARGAKKPKSRLSSSSQLFTYGSYLIHKGTGANSMGSLSQGEIIESFRDLRQDLAKTAYASYFVELLDKLIEDGERSPSLFRLLHKALQYVNEGKDAEIIARLYEIKLLSISGYRPELDKCVHCSGIDEIHSFSVMEGGFICNRCLTFDPRHTVLQPAVIKILRLLYHVDIERIGNINVKKETKDQICRLLWSFMDHHTPLRLKSRSFIEQMKDFL